MNQTLNVNIGIDFFLIAKHLQNKYMYEGLIFEHQLLQITNLFPLIDTTDGKIIINTSTRILEIAIYNN